MSNIEFKKGEKELLLCVVLGGERVKGFERGGVHPASCEVTIKHYLKKNISASLINLQRTTPSLPDI